MTPIASIASPRTGARPHDRRAVFRRPGRRIAGLVRLAGLLALLTPVLAQAQGLANERRAALRQAIGLDACVPSGKGKDYQVGTAQGQLTALDQVPWERLGAGDTVRIHHRPTPYAGKILIAGNGRKDAILRVCGVPSADGQRPVVTGVDAVTRRNLDYGHELHQSRAVVMIKSLASRPWESHPTHVQIDGLHIRGAHPRHAFIDASGARKRYEAFGACIWVERGKGVTIADNEISDCSQGIFTKSTDDGDFAHTTDVHIAGNDFHNNGLAGVDRNHSVYVQSIGVVYEFNRFGPLRAGARGNSIKDRSVGTVVRYNRIEDGARAIDLVEAEDYALHARTLPAYRTSFVYGNQITKDGRKGSTIHYGGDHNGSAPGDTWGEVNNRKGVLHVYHNTVRITGNGYGVLFQLSTTEEQADVRNNVFLFDASVPNPSMRSGTDVGRAWQSGGVIHFDRNWISRGWRDAAPGARVHGALHGVDKLIQGTTPPVDPVTFRPRAGTAILDAAVPLAAAARAHPVLYELDENLVPRRRARTATLGAREP